MKIIRKVTVLLWAVLLFLLATPYVSAAEDAKLVVGSISGRRGETVSIDVVLTAVGGAASGGFNVIYDPSALQLVSAESGEVLSGANAQINDKYAANTVRVTFAAPVALPEAGDVLHLQFRISAGASVGSHTITLDRAKLMDVDSRVTPCAIEAGGVTVQAASMELSSVKCAPGQEATLNVVLVGDFLPSGGGFELRYDATKLTSALVKAEPAIGGTPITLLSGVDTQSGIVRITWAAAEPIGAMGKLCSVTFVSGDDAVGSADVTFSAVSFYDESGNPVDTYACTNGSISFAEEDMRAPKLYLLGGQREPDGTATVRIVMDAPNLVCGGSFKLTYDVAVCASVELITSTDSLITNPSSISDANGQISVAWMHASPPPERETIVELRFTFNGSAASTLKISDVSLSDKNGDEVTAEVFDGEVGIASNVQRPIIVESEQRITGVLLDAAYCRDITVTEVTATIAFYKSGRMVDVAVFTNMIAFQEDGTAAFDFEILAGSDIDQAKIFFADTSFVPMSESVSIKMSH